MNKKSILKSLKVSTGFTLIELLVVIAIIGILSAVVVVSINSAREKSKIASIKSTLKQLYNQAEINYVTTGSYMGSNISDLNQTCTGPNNNLQKIAQPLIDQGIEVKCLSFYGSDDGGYYIGDDYRRFGATALIYESNNFKAWSVDENGVVTWDTKGVDINGNETTPDVYLGMTWPVAKEACSKSGGRLPSIEQLQTLSFAWYSKAVGDPDRWAPFGFYPNFYWSSTPVPSDPTVRAYYQHMMGGYLNHFEQTNEIYVRCVR